MPTFVNANHQGIRLMVEGRRHRFGRGALISAEGALADALAALPGVRPATEAEVALRVDREDGVYSPPVTVAGGTTTSEATDALRALLDGQAAEGRVRDGESTAEMASVGETGGGDVNAPDPSIAAAGPTQLTTEVVRGEEGDGIDEATLEALTNPDGPGVPDEVIDEAEASIAKAQRIAELSALFEREPWRAEDLDGFTIEALREYNKAHEDALGKIPSTVTRRDDIQNHIEQKRTEVS